MIFCLSLLGCHRNKEIKSLEGLEEAIKNGNDTTFVDENGEKVELQINKDKIVTINNSINGKVIYSLATHRGKILSDQFGNIAKTVFKSDYKNDSISVGISDDSLFVGEVFTGLISADHDNCIIKIAEPRTEITNSDFNEAFRFNFNCEREGVYIFKGEIVFDSVSSFPFEYKFIVVPKNPI